MKAIKEPLIDPITGLPILSHKKRLRREQICNQLKIGTKKKVHVQKPKVGYLFIYKATPTTKDVEFARLHNIKLAPYLNIYSRHNDIAAINKVFANRSFWSYDNELKYLKYEYQYTLPITNPRLLLIRQSSFWSVEKRTIPDMINNENTVVYTCFTNLHYLRHLNKKSGIKAWIFTDKKNKPDFHLRNVNHYNKFIKKGRVIVTDSVVAKQCLKLRSSKGHTTNFIYDERLVPKTVTKSNFIRKPKVVNEGKHLFEHDPVKQRLVCITDGKTVWRRKQYQANKVVKRFPKLFYFCSKVLWQLQEKELRKKTPKLSTIGKDNKTRKERRFPLQKKPVTRRFHREQFVTGKWVTDEGGETQTFVEVGTPKRVLHYKRPQTITKQWYNPTKRKKPSMFETIETPIKKMIMSKFPYGKEIVINYTEADKDGVIQHVKKEHCKLVNKKIIQEQPTKRKLKDGSEIDDIEQIVICSLKDVDTWMHQEDYPKESDGKIDVSKWIQTVSIKDDIRVTKRKVAFHLPKKIKKTKKWKHPIKDNRFPLDKNGFRIPF